jgi:uridine phosphorylase
MTEQNLLSHLKCYPKDLTPCAIVVGDPNRVRDTAALMNDVREVGNNREYLTVTGLYKGQKITVSSHGVGAGGANASFMELLRGGVQLFIRAGTCGALKPEINDGDFIIATGAVREDAATDHLMPLPYPAVADRHITTALVEAASRHGVENPHEGLIVSEANFYSAMYPPRWKTYVGYGAAAVEMEMAPLFVLAGMNGARAGGIVTADGNLVSKNREDGTDHDPFREVVAKGKQKMLQVALEAMAIVMEG